MSGSQNATWLGAHLRVAGTKETKTFQEDQTER